jgi:hypothetical protein
VKPGRLRHAAIVSATLSCVLLIASCSQSRTLDRELILPEQLTDESASRVARNTAAMSVHSRGEYLKVHMRDGHVYVLETP